MGLSDTEIRIFPDPCLRQITKPVLNPRDPQIHRIVALLAETMRSQKHGIGMAAPQVGISLQIVVLDVSKRTSKPEGLMVLINPSILAQDGEVLSREGCMSLPDYRGDIRRYNRILAEWTDLEGGHHKEEVLGIKAICMQHEIDHLKGKLFIDHIVSLKRDLIPRKV